MKSRAVFTDIDGVLHPPPRFRGPESVSALAVSTGQQMRLLGLFCWAENLETVLSEVEQRTGEDIPLVIHSTWRKQPWVSLHTLRQALGPLGHRLMAATSPDLEREDSILDLAERAGIEDYLVLDDASSEFSSRVSNLLITNPLRGVSDPAVLNAIKGWAGALCSDSRTLKVPVA
jgi:hypothetical protein